MTGYEVREVQRALSPDEATALVGTPVERREPNLDEPVVASDSDTGEPVFAYLPIGDVRDLRRFVTKIKWGTTLREHLGLRNVSRTFGFSPRRPMRGKEGCATAALSAQDPDGHRVLQRTADAVQETLKSIFPDVWDADHATMSDSVLNDWRLGETTWTSGVINKSSSLPYHRDGFNFPVWTAMPVVRRNMRGGYLHIPEYDVTVASRDGWAVFFPGYQLVHGVTPMEPTRDDGYRISVVFYALRGMKDCFTHAVETQYALRRRTERERDMAARVKAGDLAIPGREQRKRRDEAKGVES